MSFRSLWLTVTLFAASFVSCAGGGGSTDCQSIVLKVQGCGMIPRNASFQCSEPVGGSERCMADCDLKATCADLTALVCGGTTSASFDACLNACKNVGRLACATGSQTYGDQYRCDGYADCGDGSDEAGCPTFKCQDGSTILARLHCDGSFDCSDGSDETGCPTFRCQSGQTVGVSRRCDGWTDCSDGSDELGCPPSLQDIVICK